MAFDIVMCSLKDLQRLAYKLDPSGDVAQNVLIAGGAISPSGLSVGFKTTVMEVSTTAIPLPATAFTDRNFMAIRNLSTTETLYIGNSDVEANENIGNTAGWQIGPNETYNVDITDSIVLYGVIASGTIKIQVKEIA